METNPILTLHNVVITLLAQKDCDLQKIRDYFEKAFTPETPLDSEDFKKAYMYVHQFMPSKALGNQRLIYLTVKARFMLQRTQLLGMCKIKLHTADDELRLQLRRAITMLEILPDFV